MNIENITIKKCMITVDVSMECIDETVSRKANLIIAHHHPFQGNMDAILDIAHEKYRLLTAHNTWVYSLDEAWTFASEGIAQTMCQALQLPCNNSFFSGSVETGNITGGCICKLEKDMVLTDLLQKIENIVGKASIKWFFNRRDHVKTILVIPGEVNTTSWLMDAVRLKTDMVIGGEFSRTARLALLELGINAMEVSHYEMDLLGMSKLKFLLALKHPAVDFDLFEEAAERRC
nr:Nif3-like dinuclear metal center hexameric protein [Candidatus Sigynarchaeota archaeon]